MPLTLQFHDLRFLILNFLVDVGTPVNHFCALDLRLLQIALLLGERCLIVRKLCLKSLLDRSGLL